MNLQSAIGNLTGKTLVTLGRQKRFDVVAVTSKNILLFIILFHNHENLLLILYELREFLLISFLLFLNHRYLLKS